MLNQKTKALAGASAAALLLLGGIYAWRNTSQHKTNEFSNTFRDNDVTLVEDFKPITDWAQGQTVNKDISVKNNTTVATGSSAYVRISLKEFLEFTNKTENLSTIRYAVTTAGDFAKFDNQTDAQTYATANGLDVPVQVPTTAYEGNNKWFIPTKAGATHGQYGKFLVLSVGGGTPKSIIDATVAKATNVNHQALTHAEDAYTSQTFQNGGTDINAARYYDPAKLVTDYPTGGGIETGKDLKDYITWSFGPNVTTLADFDASKATSAQWVIDTATGWVYWSEALAPSQTTTHFLDSVTLSQSPENAALYYAIHTDLEAVDYSDIDTLTLPPKIKDAWKKQKIKVYFKDFTGATDVLAPVKDITASNPDLEIPAAPAKANEYFLGWATSPNAANTETLYVPRSNYTDIRQALNTLDQQYLGYTVKSEHEIKNIQKDTTLYAVYYKQLKATNAQAQEFIWNNAIWRVLNKDANTATNRLAIKVNVLTEKEATGTGNETDAYLSKFREGYNYYFSVNGTNGYQASGTVGGLKTVNDYYYANSITSANKVAVQAVNLNDPDYATYTGKGFDGKATSTTDWEWVQDTNDLNRYKHYRDVRFETTFGGTKQAFALSYGDIHGALGVSITLSSIKAGTPLLDFPGTSHNYFWLRSAGQGSVYTTGVNGGDFNIQYMYTPRPVRPALYLSVN